MVCPFSVGTRKDEADSRKGREPDPPQGHLGEGWLPGSLAERHYAHQHNALVCEQLLGTREHTPDLLTLPPLF